jgi:histidinol phosphatase-like PHP family hydrolase
MKTINLHIHTKYSDGIFSPQELIEAAIHYGINVIGFSDHYLTTKTTAMDTPALKAYISEISSLKLKYRHVVRIYMGVELDCSESEFNIAHYDYSLLNKLDYVLLEYVNDRMHDGVPLSNVLSLRDKISVPLGLAHNDMGRNFEGIKHSVLAELLANHGIFVELCTSRSYRRFEQPYYRLYREFFRDYGNQIKLSVGSDVHTEIEDIAYLGDALRFIEELNLEKSLIF